MNPQTKVKLLMERVGIDLFTLSDKSGIQMNQLSALMHGARPATPPMKKKIDNLLIDFEICPDCGDMILREGGCKFCFCGWSLCG